MRKIITIALLFCGFFFGGLFIVNPAFQEYQLQRERNKILKEEFENLENYIEGINQLGEKMKDHKESLDLIKTAFPEDHDAPALFLYLEDTISENGLGRSGEMGSFSSKAYSPNEIDHNRIKVVDFSIGISGEYPNIKNFFIATEKSARIIKVNHMSISKSTESRGTIDPFEVGEATEEAIGSDGNLSVKIEANTYSY
jgi:Tfp pilus assembly protein PilO